MTRKYESKYHSLRTIYYFEIIHTKTNATKRSSPLQGQLALALQLQTKHTHVLASNTHTYNPWGALEHEGERG